MNENIKLNSNSCDEDENDTLEYQSQDKYPVYDRQTPEDTTSEYQELADKKKSTWITERDKDIEFKYDHSVSVFDVAAYILKNIGQMTTMKLQKLVYYCQAWSLVWDEKPLFKEPIEAWANGPVVRKLFDHHRGQFLISSVMIGNPDIFNQEQKETINAVLDYYGKKSSQWLIDLTHMEGPWKKARAGIDEMERGNKVIGLDVMAEYYSSLPFED